MGLVVTAGAAARWREEVRRERERAEHHLYLATFLEARESQRAGRHGEALRLLQACAPAWRHWEWRWLERELLPPSRRVACGAPPLALGVSPDGSVLVVTAGSIGLLDPTLSRWEKQVPLPNPGPEGESWAAANSLGAVVATRPAKAAESILHHAPSTGPWRPVSWRVPGRVAAVSAPARNGTVALVVQRDRALSLEIHALAGRRLAGIHVDQFSWPAGVKLSEDGRRCLLLGHRVGSMNEPSPILQHELRGDRLVEVPFSIGPDFDGFDQAGFGPGGWVAGAGLQWGVDFGGPAGDVTIPAPLAGPVRHLEVSPGGGWWAASDGSALSLVHVDPARRLVRPVTTIPVPGAEVVCVAAGERGARAGGLGGIVVVGTADGVLQVHDVGQLADPSEVELTGLTGHESRGALFEGAHTLRLEGTPAERPSRLSPAWQRLVSEGWLQFTTNGMPLDGEFARVWPHRRQALVKADGDDPQGGWRLVSTTERTEPTLLSALRGQGWVLHCVSGDLQQAGLERAGIAALLDLTTGRLRPLPGRAGEQARPLAVSDDGRRVLLRRSRGEVQQLMLGTLDGSGKRFQTAILLPGGSGAALAHAFSRDGRRLLAGGRTLRLLDADTGLELLMLVDYGHPESLEPSASVDLIELYPDEKAVFCRTARYGMDRLIRFSR